MIFQLCWKYSARRVTFFNRSLLSELLTPAAWPLAYRYNMSSEADSIPAKPKSDALPKVSNNMSKNDETNKVTKTIVTSPHVYKPVGPYSQAILVNNSLLYVSGVLGMDSQAQLVCGGAAAETRQILENMRHVLEAGGASLDSVVKTTILLTDLNDFQAVNQVYAEFFPKDPPTRATFQVSKLPKDASVEIEAVALSGDLVVSEAGPCPCSRV